MTMIRNMGSADRFIRIVIAAIVVFLYKANVIGGTTAIILLILSAVFILTSLISFCPLYLPFGISTRKKKNDDK